MKFDESKVFTLLNADKVKIRDKGYFADNLSVLKNAVLTEDRELFGEITRILADVAPCRFGIKDDESGYGEYGLFYLVEEPKEEEFRSYNDVNEMIEDFEKRFYLVPQALNLSQALRLPQIWVKGKPEGKCKDEIVQVVGFYKDLVTICRAYDVNEFTLYELFDHFTYLDGSPCGIKED